MQNFDSRIEHSLKPVVARWDKQDKDLLIPLFRLIASGEPLEEAKLAEDLGRKTDAVSTELGTSLAEIDSSGRVSELFGITREPTLHRIEVGGVTLYSCCAFVAHRVPSIMQQAVIVESTDPINGSKIDLAISAESELQDVDPSTACSSMVDCVVEEIIASPRTKFCCHVKHFDSSESADEYASTSPNLFVMRIEDFNEGALWLNGRIWR